MAYWMRVFCTEGEPPPLEDVLTWVAERGPALALDTDLIDVDPSSPGWTQAAISYRPEKQPFLAETIIATEPEAKEELDEFVELLEDAQDSPAKGNVLAHLRQTTFIVANQIPTSDFENDGYDSVGEFMRFFVEQNGGMIQADGEGFYEGDKLVVQLD